MNEGEDETKVPTGSRDRDVGDTTDPRLPLVDYCRKTVLFFVIDYIFNRPPARATECGH